MHLGKKTLFQSISYQCWKYIILITQMRAHVYSTMESFNSHQSDKRLRCEIPPTIIFWPNFPKLSFKAFPCPASCPLGNNRQEAVLIDCNVDKWSGSWQLGGEIIYTVDTQISILVLLTKSMCVRLNISSMAMILS